MMINFKTYSYEENEHLYGPGKRLLLFCQGCSLHCKGCVNKHLWDFGVGENITPQEVVELCKDVEGITLHGGEPLDQAEGVLEIIKLLKENNKTVILFTGYKFKELETLHQKLSWKLSDLVVSGRYEQDKRNIYLQFRGSTNQRVYRHKGKYKNFNIQDGKTVGVLRLSENGSVSIRGFQDDNLTKLLNSLLFVNQ